MRSGQTTLRRLLLSVAKLAPDQHSPSLLSVPTQGPGTPVRTGYPRDVATAGRDDDAKRDVPRTGLPRDPAG